MIYNPNEKVEIPKIGMLKIGVPKITMPNVFGTVVRENKKDSGYIRKGLVFHLDGIDKGANEGKWTDLVGGVEFTPASDAVIFAYDNVTGGVLNVDTPVQFPQDTSTIEVALYKTKAGNPVPFRPGGNKLNAPITFGLYNKIFIYGVDNNNKFTSKDLGLGNNYLYNLIGICSVSANRNVTIFNGQAYENAALDYWSGNYINARVETSNIRLYSIRIYNRHLSEAEMRHNQAVDYNRFFKDIVSETDEDEFENIENEPLENEDTEG